MENFLRYQNGILLGYQPNHQSCNHALGRQSVTTANTATIKTAVVSPSNFG